MEAKKRVPMEVLLLSLIAVLIAVYARIGRISEEHSQIEHPVQSFIVP